MNIIFKSWAKWLSLVFTHDFVVWTTKDLFVQTINFDSDLWINTCLPKLKYFYYFLKSCIPTCLLPMIIHTTSLICIAIFLFSITITQRTMKIG